MPLGDVTCSLKHYKEINRISRRSLLMISILQQVLDEKNVKGNSNIF